MPIQINKGVPPEDIFGKGLGLSYEVRETIRTVERDAWFIVVDPANPSTSSSRNILKDKIVRYCHSLQRGKEFEIRTSKAMLGVAVWRRPLVPIAPPPAPAPGSAPAPDQPPRPVPAIAKEIRHQAKLPRAWRGDAAKQDANQEGAHG